MKLDRNLNADGRGKYGLILNRKLGEALERKYDGGDADPLILQDIKIAVAVLERAGILDWGDTVDTEFFVLRCRDKYTNSGLVAYARKAYEDDPDYAREVYELAQRSGIHHPNAKVPD